MCIAGIAIIRSVAVRRYPSNQENRVLVIAFATPIHERAFSRARAGRFSDIVNGPSRIVPVDGIPNGLRTSFPKSQGPSVHSCKSSIPRVGRVKKRAARSKGLGHIAHLAREHSHESMQCAYPKAAFLPNSWRGDPPRAQALCSKTLRRISTSHGIAYQSGYFSPGAPRECGGSVNAKWHAGDLDLLHVCSRCQSFSPGHSSGCLGGVRQNGYGLATLEIVISKLVFFEVVACCVVS